MKLSQENNGNYDDIINLPHHVSEVHPRMSMLNRAAQFAPFAALSGYGDAIKETARLTDTKVELDENSKEMLDEKLQLIQEQSYAHPQISVTYFQPDKRKNGGEYVTVAGKFKKIDLYERSVVMMDGMRIKIEDITEIEI